ncbi:hypothetical protein AG0111_0g3627 [Alternaria gaisen]|uniref:Uncharacterized protein n=1 Tax=Alternaria gaisen TaxID=167740 RepID=A0ACB6FTY1_9PLEO|nr:hypothetical protein AG0111_0g3627 [Alternaria gaisen]
MSFCVPCNRPFVSETALKAHEKSSPKHVPFSCKECNRSFKTQVALSSHQEHSTAHRTPRRDSVTTSVTAVPFTQYVPLRFSRASNVPSATQGGQRSGHNTTDNISRANPTFDLDSMPLEDTLQALTISDVSTPIAQPKIGRAQIPQRQEETRTSFTFPELHQRIAEAVAPAITSTWFNSNTKAHPGKEKDTNIIGTFTCVNKKCGKDGWSSGLVAIHIRGYSRNGYNAVVFNQRCKSCGWLGSLKMDEKSYIERVAFRLNTWAGVRIEHTHFSSKMLQGPHESEYCEGCKAGHCPRGRDF